MCVIHSGQIRNKKMWDFKSYLDVFYNESIIKFYLRNICIYVNVIVQSTSSLTPHSGCLKLNLKITGRIERQSSAAGTDLFPFCGGIARCAMEDQGRPEFPRACSGEDPG